MKRRVEFAKHSDRTSDWMDLQVKCVSRLLQLHLGVTELHHLKHKDEGGRSSSMPSNHSPFPARSPPPASLLLSGLIAFFVIPFFFQLESIDLTELPAIK